MENINNNKNKQENIKQKEELTMNTNEENEIQNITNKFFDALSIETIIGNEINPEIINKMKEIKKKAEEFYQGLKNKDVEIINKYTSFNSNY